MAHLLEIRLLTVVTSAVGNTVCYGLSISIFFFVYSLLYLMPFNFNFKQGNVFSCIGYA